MKRRDFLVGGVGAGVAVAVGAELSGDPTPSWSEGPLVRYLEDRFSEIRLDPDAVAAFARAHEAAYGAWDPRRAPTWPIGGQFLLSTDFFQTGADERRPAKFLALYDPYVTPCYDPFAGG